jgi:hypothetical protein
MKIADLFVPGLAIYPEIALVLFLIVFALVLVAVCSPRASKKWEGAGALPLEDTSPGARREQGSGA